MVRCDRKIRHCPQVWRYRQQNTEVIAGSSTSVFRALLKDSGRTENSLWRWLIEYRLI